MLRCQELAGDLPGTAVIDPCGLLGRKDRGALGLGSPDGLGYVQARHEVAIYSLARRALLLAVHPQVIVRLQTSQTWRIVRSLTALAGGPITPARHRAADY
jgi:hypothetical protein